MDVSILSCLFLLAIFLCFGSIVNNVFCRLYSVEKYLFVTDWGSLGTSNGQFDKPHEVAVDSSGKVYVADTENNRIQKFSSNGTFIAKWGSNCSSALDDLHCQNPADGEFANPTSIAVDSSGKVYVADTENNRIQKFSSNGTFIAKWGSTCNLHISVGCTNSSNHLDEGDGQFNSPTSVAVNPSSGNVYVADYGNNRIQEFTSSGIFLKWWGFEGQLDGYFTAPSSVAVNPSSGNVYVADYGNNRIQEFTSSGIFLKWWGFEGQLDGYFTAPSSVAVNPSSGNVYVTDTGNNRIQEFTSSGIFIAKWGSSGSGDGQFIGPASVAVDPSSGNVYVADYGNNRIQVFTGDGTFITELGSYGSGNYQFTGPKGVAVDPSSGNVYVTDIFNNRIQVFALMPTFTFK
jgi:tripartite motif-containing protein 71